MNRFLFLCTFAFIALACKKDEKANTPDPAFPSVLLKGWETTVAFTQVSGGPGYEGYVETFQISYNRDSTVNNIYALKVTDVPWGQRDSMVIRFTYGNRKEIRLIAFHSNRHDLWPYKTFNFAYNEGNQLVTIKRTYSGWDETAWGDVTDTLLYTPEGKIAAIQQRQSWWEEPYSTKIECSPVFSNNNVTRYVTTFTYERPCCIPVGYTDCQYNQTPASRWHRLKELVEYVRSNDPARELEAEYLSDKLPVYSWYMHEGNVPDIVTWRYTQLQNGLPDSIIRKKEHLSRYIEPWYRYDSTRFIF